MDDRQKVLSLIFSQDHCQKFSPWPISYKLRAGFEAAQNLSSGSVESNFATNLRKFYKKPIYKKFL